MFNNLINTYKENQARIARDAAEADRLYRLNKIKEAKELSAIAHKNINFINATINNINFHFHIPKQCGVKERNRIRRIMLRNIEWYENKLIEETYWAEYYLRKIKTL